MAFTDYLSNASTTATPIESPVKAKEVQDTTLDQLSTLIKGLPTPTVASKEDPIKSAFIEKLYDYKSKVEALEPGSNEYNKTNAEMSSLIATTSVQLSDTGFTSKAWADVMGVDLTKSNVVSQQVRDAKLEADYYDKGRQMGAMGSRQEVVNVGREATIQAKQSELLAQKMELEIKQGALSDKTQEQLADNELSSNVLGAFNIIKSFSAAGVKPNAQQILEITKSAEQEIVSFRNKLIRLGIKPSIVEERVATLDKTFKSLLEADGSTLNHLAQQKNADALSAYGSLPNAAKKIVAMSQVTGTPVNLMDIGNQNIKNILEGNDPTPLGELNPSDQKTVLNSTINALASGDAEAISGIVKYMNLVGQRDPSVPKVLYVSNPKYTMQGIDAVSAGQDSNAAAEMGKSMNNLYGNLRPQLELIVSKLPKGKKLSSLNGITLDAGYFSDNTQIPMDVANEIRAYNSMVAITKHSKQKLGTRYDPMEINSYIKDVTNVK